MGCNFSSKTIEIGWIPSPELWWWSVSLHPYLFTKEGEKFVYRAMYTQCTHNVWFYGLFLFKNNLLQL